MIKKINWDSLLSVYIRAFKENRKRRAFPQAAGVAGREGDVRLGVMELIVTSRPSKFCSIFHLQR